MLIKSASAPHLESMSFIPTVFCGTSLCWFIEWIYCNLSERFVARSFAVHFFCFFL